MTINQNPLISIIVTVYNIEKYISECLESLVNQTYKNIEIICVNDGSTDSGGEIVEQYKKKDGRIELINQVNSGVSVARNKGVSEAKGEFVFFVDGDDFLDKEAVEKVVNFLVDNNSVDVVCFGFKELGDCRNRIKVCLNLPQTIKSVSDFVKIPVACWAKAYRLNYLQKFCIQFETGVYFEDIPFHWKVLLSSNKIGVLRDAIYNYRTIRYNSYMDQARKKKRGMAIHHLYCLDLVFSYLMSMNGGVPQNNKLFGYLFEVYFKNGYGYVHDDELNEYVKSAKDFAKKWKVQPRKFTFTYDVLSEKTVIKFKYRFANSIMKCIQKVKIFFGYNDDYFPRR